VSQIFCYAECHYAECRYTDCRGTPAGVLTPVTIYDRQTIGSSRIRSNSILKLFRPPVVEHLVEQSTYNPEFKGSNLAPGPTASKRLDFLVKMANRRDEETQWSVF
jgi:hypothetical protein